MVPLDNLQVLLLLRIFALFPLSSLFNRVSISSFSFIYIFSKLASVLMRIVFPDLSTQTLALLLFISHLDLLATLVMYLFVVCWFIFLFHLLFLLLKSWSMYNLCLRTKSMSVHDLIYVYFCTQLSISSINKNACKERI